MAKRLVSVFLLVVVIVLAVPSPAFASPVSPPNVREAMAPYAEEFAVMAGETAERFGPNVVYEIWNEEDIREASSIYLSPEEYALLLDGAYKAIKGSTHWRATVVVGGLASGDPGYLHAVVKAQQWRLKADGVGLHPYAKYTADEMRHIIYAYRQIAWKPIWITEFGYGELPPEEQANYLQMAAGVFRSYGWWVQAPTWYCWSDIMNQGFGLVTGGGERKATYEAFPKGYGINIDPCHGPHFTPTPEEVKELGAGWVRMVYRPWWPIDWEETIKGYQDAGIKVILVLNQETLWTDNILRLIEEARRQEEEERATAAVELYPATGSRRFI